MNNMAKLMTAGTHVALPDSYERLFFSYNYQK